VKQRTIDYILSYHDPDSNTNAGIFFEIIFWNFTISLKRPLHTLALNSEFNRNNWTQAWLYVASVLPFKRTLCTVRCSSFILRDVWTLRVLSRYKVVFISL